MSDTSPKSKAKDPKPITADTPAAEDVPSMGLFTMNPDPAALQPVPPESVAAGSSEPAVREDPSMRPMGLDGHPPMPTAAALAHSPDGKPEFVDAPHDEAKTTSPDKSGATWLKSYADGATTPSYILVKP